MSEVIAASDQGLPRRKWNVVIGVNFALGLLLWFGYFTDYSVVGTWPDLLLPPVVGLVGLFSWRSAKNVSSEAMRRIHKLSSLPSIIGGCLPVLLAVIMLIPPFTLGFLFALEEIKGETRIHRVVSPDGWRLAEAYFRPVGAYSGGNGRIQVRVRYSLFPLVERDVYHLRRSYASKKTKHYLYWVDSDTLYISEKEQQLELGRLGFELPSFLAFPLRLIRVLSSASESAR